MWSRVALPAFMLVLMLSAGSVLATEVYIDPSSMDITTNDEFSISVSVSDVQDLYGFQFDIGFDSSILDFVGIEQGPMLSSDGEQTYWSSPDTSTPGLLDNAISTRLGMISGIDGDGVLARVTFRPLRSGTAHIDLSDVVLGDGQAARISTGTNNAAYNVVLQGTYHRADTDGDGYVGMRELMDFIDLWFAGQEGVSMPEVMEAVRIWTGGFS